MKKYLLFFAILIVSGCALISSYKERNEINEILREKEFYIIEGKSYKCNVKGPFKAKAEVVNSDIQSHVSFLYKANISDRIWYRYKMSDNNILIFLNKDSENEKEVVLLSDIKMKQTIFSEKQLFAALNEIGGGCRCAWHIVEGKEEHYTAVIEKSVFDKEFPIVKKVFEEKATAAKKKLQKEKAKKEAALVDCKQAKEKAENRKKEIKTALGLKSNDYLYWGFLDHKVVDFSTNGIFIENDCYANRLRDMHLVIQYGADLRNLCREERVFIYTADSYARNDFFDGGGWLYIQVENYKYQTVAGGRNVVKAYKQIPYKAEEIDYTTYLKNKKNRCE